VIAMVALGLLAGWVWPLRARAIAIGVEAFALLGTLVGAVTIAIGIGPRTVPDTVYHALLVLGLIAGLFVTWKVRR
jgi:hypothetical protein